MVYQHWNPWSELPNLIFRIYQHWNPMFELSSLISMFYQNWNLWSDMPKLRRLKCKVRIITTDIHGHWNPCSELQILTYRVYQHKFTIRTAYANNQDLLTVISRMRTNTHGLGKARYMNPLPTPLGQGCALGGCLVYLAEDLALLIALHLLKMYSIYICS